ncbi:MAG: putative selenium-dependent hydroxylase accessory protein YqeC [Chloroflexi bacterium]|nr:putative selenium-dependent hydroxylase accessory protein YqeC [Chloroflexota bacterium]
MLLWQAFQIRDGDVVALVGAGGKTTAMYRLARELVAEGKGVVVTTTTRIYPPTGEQASLLLVEAERDELVRRVARWAGRPGVVAVASGYDEIGKLVGVPDEWVSALKDVVGVANVVVEADGAAGRPFKAPRAYEPVIPSCATLVVPVVGVEVVGCPLTAEMVHRPEEVSRLTGLLPGEVVTAEVVAQVMLYPLGNVKGAPPSARIVPLVNKVEDASALETARQVAKCLLALGMDRVVVGRVAREVPVVEVVAASVPSGVGP